MNRISELPDSVLTHILSFLPTKDSIKTTILSKRFENQWVLVPNLIFHATNSTPQFVNQALALWGGPTSPQLNKLDIEFNPPPLKDVRVWLRFALQHSAQTLRLVFCDNYFQLPQDLYSSSCLQALELACCVIAPRTQIQWSNLKNLSVTCVKLSNELIKNLITGSVRLEVFEISNCTGYDSLVLDSTSLKILKITDNLEYSDAPVTISGSSISKVCIGGVWRRKITFVCLPALVDADLRFSYRTKVDNSYSYSYNYRVNEYVHKVVEKLHFHHSIERLVIGTMFIEAITLAEVKTLPPQLSKCRSLTLSTNTEINVLKGILKLVKMLPNLEVLILDMELWDKWYSSGSEVESFLMSEVEDCRFLFQHLKIVKITSHVDRLPAFPFIKFLLDHARALEIMSIFPKTASTCAIDYMFQLIQGLSDLPRSSPIAKVVLQKGQTKIPVEINSCNSSVYDLSSEATSSKRARTRKSPESGKPTESKNPV